MILVVGLSPTLQRTQWFETLVPGDVNRARRTVVTASGKAVNVARVAATLGSAATLVQPLGGDGGRFIARSLEIPGLTQETIRVEDDASTRTCTTILLKNGPATELLEEAPRLSPADSERVAAAAERLLPTARALCLSGSLPAGAPDDLYARLIAAARRYQVPALVDAQKAPLHAALRERPWLVKPNRQEAAATLDLPLTDDAIADAVRLAEALLDAGARNALVSIGKAGALLAESNVHLRWHFVPPEIDVVNPIGSGDSLAAGVLHAHFTQGRALTDAVLFGAACAAANCLSETSGVVSPDAVAALVERVRCEEIPR